MALTPAVRDTCIKRLRDALAGDEFWPSMHAAEALTGAGYGEQVRQALLPRLASEQDAQHRCGLARELVRTGDRTKIAVMLGILAARDPYGHTHACESLYKVNEIGDGRLLRAAMADTANRRKALMAAAALARWGNPAAFRLIRQWVRDPDADIASVAAWVLARIGNASDIPALRQGAERFNRPLIRAYFQHALAARGDAAGRAALLRNLAGDDPAIQTYAAAFAGEARLLQAKDRLIHLLNSPAVDVRVRAAQALLVLAQPPQQTGSRPVVCDVYKATAEHPRYSEGSVVVLRDGSLLYAVTEFIGGAQDAATAHIIARRSSDGGRSWSKPRVLQENVGKQNVMSVTLRYLAYPLDEETPLGMFYLVKNSGTDLKVYLRMSHDDGRSFGKPILVTDDPGYHCMNNDRVALLSTGRLVAPVAWTADCWGTNHYQARCYLSDDGGRTWRQSADQVDYPKRGAMEPEVLQIEQIADGVPKPTSRLLMTLRTQLGHIAFSYSEDAGDHWSKAKPWSVRAPEAPSTLRQIPSTGDWLLVWNDTFVEGADHGGSRTPLTIAISCDQAKTWKYRQNIEPSKTHTFSYASVAFYHGRVLLSYYVRDNKTGRISSRFRSMPIAMLYEGGVR